MEIEDEEDKMSEEEKVVWIEKLQEAAAAKQVNRTETMGQLLRSKGFLWIATSHDIIGGWQQAGTRPQKTRSWYKKHKKRFNSSD